MARPTWGDAANPLMSPRHHRPTPAEITEHRTHEGITMQKTSISWTQYTSNLIRAVNRETGKRGWACTKISPACAPCYAEATNQRWGTGFPFTDQANEQVEWVFIETKIAALMKRRKPALIFMVDMT